MVAIDFPFAFLLYLSSSFNSSCFSVFHFYSLNLYFVRSWLVLFMIYSNFGLIYKWDSSGEKYIRFNVVLRLSLVLYIFWFSFFVFSFSSLCGFLSKD